MQTSKNNKTNTKKTNPENQNTGSFNLPHVAILSILQPKNANLKNKDSLKQARKNPEPASTQNQNTQNPKSDLTNSQNIQQNQRLQEAFLHVYHKDVDTSLKNKKTSLLRLMQFKTGTKLKQAKPAKKGVTFSQAIFASVLFIVVGVFAIYVADTIKTNSKPKTYFKRIQNQIVLADSITKLNVTNLTPSAAKQLAIDSAVYQPPGTVVELLFLKKDNEKGGYTRLTPEEFVKLFNLTIPQEAVESFQDYFVGHYYTRYGVYPIVLFKTNFPEAALYNMKKWEYKALPELQPFFPIPDSPIKLFTEETQFVDTALDNIDIRVLADQEGTPLFIYGLLDQSLLFWANNADAIKEINRRLQYY